MIAHMDFGNFVGYTAEQEIYFAMYLHIGTEKDPSFSLKER
jgi:hypothetical protein